MTTDTTTLSIQNSAHFKSVLNEAIRNAKTQRSIFQSLIVYGLGQAQNHGNLTPLSSLLTKCIGVRSLPTIGIKSYIQAHANVKWVKGKDGEPAFKKSGKQLTVRMPTVTWFEWEGNKQATPDMDTLSQIKSLIGRIETAINNNTVKGDIDEAKAQLVTLRSVVPA